MWFTSWMLYHYSSWNQTHCYSRCSNPHSSFCLVIEWLPTHLKAWYVALNEFTESQLMGYLVYFPLSSPSDAQPYGDAFFRSFSPWRRTMEIPKKGWRLDHGDLKQRNEDINERDQPHRKDSQDREDSLEFRNQNLPSLLRLLNLGTRFLVVEENCDTRIIKLQ